MAVSELPHEPPWSAELDGLLADAVLRGETAAQDDLTRRLRPLLEAAAQKVCESSEREDLVALGLYQLMQAERRLLASWDRTAPLSAFLAAACGRVCVDEHRRWRLGRVRSLPSRPEEGVEHPTDCAMARHLLRLDPKVAGHVLGCPRCALWEKSAQAALGACRGSVE